MPDASLSPAAALIESQKLGRRLQYGRRGAAASSSKEKRFASVQCDDSGVNHDATGDEFSYPRFNLIVSQAGFSVEVRLPDGIRYEEAGRVIDVFAEMLAGPEPTMVVRRGDVRDAHGDLPEPERARVVENIGRAFAFKGWTLLVE
jgi:hypothetical protein